MLARNEEKCHTTLKVAIYLGFDMHSTPGGCAIKVAIYLGFDMHSTPGVVQLQSVQSHTAEM